MLDFTRVLAGPYATRILADFGAEVIKVQSRKTANGSELNDTSYFNMWNRGKLSITLDLSHSAGRGLAVRLAGISDVVIENFTPRVMANWGLSYQNFQEAKPDIIMVSMSGMGQTGPWRDFVAFGPTIQALSGITFLTSFTPDSPLGLGYSYADHVAGLFAAFTVSVALEHRDRTGEGQYIDFSEYEAMCALLGPVLMDCKINRKPVLPLGNYPDYPLAAPYGCFKCKGDDQWCVIAVFTDEEWLVLRNVLGNPSWTDEVRFFTVRQRREHIGELNGLLEEWTVQHNPEEIMNLLQGAGIAAGVVKNARDLAENPQLAARHFFITVTHPILGETTFDGTPMRLERTPARFGRSAARLGQDNHYVYQELLGIGNQELSYLIENGIID